MIFYDAEVKALDLTTATAIQELIEVHLCGRPTKSDLGASDRELLSEFVQKAVVAGVSFQQFNELLLVLNQDRVSRAFFRFFFGDPAQLFTMGQLQQGVVRFKGYAMVCFGNFRFAFRHLSTISSEEALRDELGPCCHDPQAVAAQYGLRTDKVLDISLINREETWFVGEITGRLVSEELKRFEEARKTDHALATDPEAVAFGQRLLEMDAAFNKVQANALRNTDVYLTWDHLDIYVATSMRNKWEYEEVFDFTQELFRSSILTPLKLRYFDPTQSKCATARDKGLLEGLMLKRADCTIYMAQETDTLGKDSELANTLAQGKPVIAYVPMIDPHNYEKVVSARPLEYAKQRLLHLQAAEITNLVDGLPRLTEDFLRDLAEHRQKQPFPLWDQRDLACFKRARGYWPELCEKLAEAEKIAFDKRALVLQKYHPLGMQINLKTGVANGVLVVRSIVQCAELLHAILTNQAEFDIQVDDGGRVLLERSSRSTFRAVTNNEKLTNSFWNFWTH